MRPRIGPKLWPLWLTLAGCAHAPPAQPAWSDDSRSDLAAQGTSIDARKEPAPPQAAAIATPAPALIPAAVQAPVPVADDDAPLPADAPVVRVLDVGAEPRVRLRYRLPGPQTEDLTMTTNMTVATSFGTITQPEMPTPGMRVLLSVTSAPAGKGELTSNGQVIDADAIDAPGLLLGLTDKLRAELRGLKGMTVQTRLTTRGMVIKAETSLPPGASPSARNTIESMQDAINRGTVLPAEAIGVGGVWETESQFRQSGVDTRQIARYRVRELAGTRVALDVEIEMSAGAQEIPLPNTNGAKAQLQEMRGTGTGTLEVDLTRAVPRRGHTSMDSQLSMKVPAGGQTLTMSTRMKLAMDLHAGR